MLPIAPTRAPPPMPLHSSKVLAWVQWCGSSSHYAGPVQVEDRPLVCLTTAPQSHEIIAHQPLFLQPSDKIRSSNGPEFNPSGLPSEPHQEAAYFPSFLPLRRRPPEEEGDDAETSPTMAPGHVPCLSDALPAAEEAGSPPASPPILLLPADALHNVLGRLSLRQALACRLVCRLFRDVISSPPFLAALPPLRLLALRYPRAATPAPSLYAFDPAIGRWLCLPLAFLPFPSSSPVTASPSLLYLWVDNAVAGDPKNPKSLVLCNPLARSYRLLPPLGSAWSRHGTVLAGPGGAVLVLTELAALAYAPGADRWLKFSLNLPSKPRSPILMGGTIYTLCDVGTPWRSEWKLFSCRLRDLGELRGWAPIERHEWGDVFDVLKRPRLLAGSGGGRILMIGGLRSPFAIDEPCSTVLILRLDLATLEWDEAGRMPPDIYRCFSGGISGVVPGPIAAAIAAGGNNKVKVFGGDGRVWFSGKRVRGKLAMWEEEAIHAWRWVDGVPGHNEGAYRGFVLNAGFTAMP